MLGKGITGGYLPLSAVLTTQAIYDAFLGEYAELKHFFHGHTYTGNPLCCAVALANLDLFEREGTLEKAYPSVFVVRMDGQVCQRVSFAYVDVLTETVRVSVCGDRADG